ncbi:MAG: hypothetical protein ACUZ8E_02610 [Candidatus Anammoxibacter sp.]
MNEDLYIDIVSRTIISRISEEIGQSIGEKLTNSLDKLLVTTLPKLISQEITPAFDKIQKEMQRTVDESDRKLQEEIKEIRQQVEHNTNEQNGLLSKVLECDFKELSSRITMDIEGLQKEMAGQSDVVQKALDTTFKTIKSQIETDVTGQFKAVEGSVTEVCSELKEIRDQIEENSKEQRRLFPKDMYSNIKSLGTEFTTGLDGLQKEIAHLKDTDRRLLIETMESLKEHMGTDIANRLKTIEESGDKLRKTLLKELPEAMPKEAALALENIQKGMTKAVEESAKKLQVEMEESRQHLHKSSGDQNKILLNVIEGVLTMIHTQFTSGLEGLKKEMTNLKDKSRIEANIMVRLKTVEETGMQLKDEIKGIRHMIDKSAKEQKILLTSIFSATNK